MARGRGGDRDFRNFVETGISWLGDLPLITVIRIAIAEFLGTAILVFVGCMGCAVGLPATPAPVLLIGLGFGFTVMLCIQIVGHISKSHINPAVTIGLVIFGDLGIPLAVIYIISQIIGGILGYGTLVVILPQYNATNDRLCVTQPAPEITAFQGMFCEMVITGILVFVVCGVFDWRNADKPDSVPIRFGLTVASLAIMAGPYTGASMNPARSLGPALWTGLWDNHWVYWVGPIGGSVIASTFYRFVFMIPRPEPEPELPDHEIPLTSVTSQENDLEKQET